MQPQAGQEPKKQKPRSPGEEKRGLAKKRMAFRDKVHCETYSSGTQEPDPEHVAAANDRLGLGSSAHIVTARLSSD